MQEKKPTWCRWAKFGDKRQQGRQFIISVRGQQRKGELQGFSAPRCQCYTPPLAGLIGCWQPHIKKERVPRVFSPSVTNTAEDCTSIPPTFVVRAPIRFPEGAGCKLAFPILMRVGAGYDYPARMSMLLWPTPTWLLAAVWSLWLRLSRLHHQHNWRLPHIEQWESFGKLRRFFVLALTQYGNPQICWY